MQFTDAQKRAIETTSKRVIVVAAAGSGKTRVLIERIVHLMLHGADVHDFLVLTFTRKAANEMRMRLASRLDELGWSRNSARDLRPMMIGTFHALALRMLRTDGERIGLIPDELTVANEEDVELLLKRVCLDMGYLRGKSWRNGLSWKEVTSNLEDYYCGITELNGMSDTVSTILNEYWLRMREINVLDFGSLLRSVQKLLGSCPDVLKRYRSRIKHVVADEIQDENPIQHGWYRFFTPPATMFLVGDLRQAIYEWRRARPEIISDMMQEEDIEIVQLSNCFRCGDAIVGVSNQLIGNDEYGSEPMAGSTGRRGSVQTLTGRYSDVAAKVDSLITNDLYNPEDIVCMARTHRTLQKADEVLNNSGIKTYRVGSSMKVMDTDSFRKLHAAMRIAVNHKDDLAFLRLVDDFELTSETYAIVRQHAVENRLHHFESLRALYPDCRLGESISQYGRESSALEVDDPFSREIIELASGFGVGETDFTDAIQFWVEQYEPRSIVNALDLHAVRDIQDDVKHKPGCVTLLTVHAAKGLEWPCVIALNMNEGSLPSGPAVRSGNISEERRIAYVAWTRASEKLVLHWQADNDEWDGPAAEPSRFLFDAGVVLENECNTDYSKMTN